MRNFTDQVTQKRLDCVYIAFGSAPRSVMLGINGRHVADHRREISLNRTWCDVWSYEMHSFFVTDKRFFIQAFVIATLVCSSVPALADHQWGSYQWSGGPLAIDVVDNTLSGHWVNHLAITIVDWDDGTIDAGWAPEALQDALDITLLPGTNSACDPVSGNVQVCNDDYGETGWLGIAQIWLSRGKNKYIVAGVAKLNDFYHDYPPYDSDSFRQLVMCQEVAHTFGLDHQDENFNDANLGTCMDYTSDPIGNEHPNQHDYDQLELMYISSTDEEPSGTCNLKSPKCQSANVPLENPGDWGRLISGHGGIEVYEKDLGNGYRVITHVTWALEHAEEDVHRRETHKR
ncbi:MAG: hypothetical protein ACI9BW_001023 [Gammaproteobacteria bacterium]|jgi:hypothetical protein